MNTWSTLLAIVLLAAITFVLVVRLGAERPWLQPWAILRACLQLGILSVFLTGIITDTRWVAAFLVVMVGAAAWVVVGRLELPRRRLLMIAPVIAGAAVVPAGIVFGTGALDLTARYVLALGGIVIGNAMTVATLSGRTLLRSIVSERAEIESWLALGATPRRATRRLARAAATTALIPATDQTRTTGIVTLPGAFVGAVFAGASPLEAAQFQLLVLAGALVAGAIVATAITGIFGAPVLLPQEQSA